MLATQSTCSVFATGAPVQKEVCIAFVTGRETREWKQNGFWFLMPAFPEDNWIGSSCPYALCKTASPFSGKTDSAMLLMSQQQCHDSPARISNAPLEKSHLCNKTWLQRRRIPELPPVMLSTTLLQVDISREHHGCREVEKQRSTWELNSLATGS